MISVAVERSQNRVCAFQVHNHGATPVCAAVSLFVINTINSIEALTDEPFTCDYQEEGGYIRYNADGETGSEAGLLLDALLLGLESVRDCYPEEIELSITDR